jgi:hypothetical protein
MAMFEERKLFLGLINYIPKFSPPMGSSNTNLDLRQIIFFILLIKSINTKIFGNSACIMRSNENLRAK